jgi:hypothetical protein
MTTLVTAIYSQYRTAIARRFDGVSPGITSRFEVFTDENLDSTQVSSKLYLLK